MAPKSVLVQTRNKSKNNTIIKKLNRCLVTNNNLQKRIQKLSDKNKKLSRARNSMLSEKLVLESVRNSIKNESTQLTAKTNFMHRKLSVLEQTVQKCIPSLVIMSQGIPSILENIHEMRKLEVKDKKNKEKQTKTVRPMIHGMTISQPTVSLKQFNMSPIIESPSCSSELTPKSPQRSSFGSSPHCKPNREPYVRLKDVAAMLKNSKAVESPKCRLNESLGEGPSWLNTREDQIQCFKNNTNATIHVINSPILMIPNEVQADVPIIDSTSSSMGNTFNETYETEVWHSDLISPVDSSMMRNITFRNPNKRLNKTSNASDINDSTSPVRPCRSTTKKVNYKEKTLKNKPQK